MTPDKYATSFLRYTDCKVKYGLTHTVHGGLGHGEPPEQAWSLLGGFGMRTMSVGLAHRAVALEYAFQEYNSAKRTGLVDLLVAMHKKATSQKEAAEDELANIWAFAKKLSVEDKLDMTAQVGKSIGYPNQKLRTNSAYHGYASRVMYAIPIGRFAIRYSCTHASYIFAEKYGIL